MNTTKGFAIPLVLAIVAALAIGGGVYVQNKNNKADVQTNVSADIHAGIDHDIDGSGSASEPAVSSGSMGSEDTVFRADGSIGIGATSSLINNRRPAPPEANASIQQQVTVEGEYACLPHANTSGPQTMECALGLKADNGSYYALDLMGAGENLAIGLATGGRIKVSGLMVPVEALSSLTWQKYAIKGIIRATAVVKI